MAIEITGRHIDVSDAMKRYAETKALQLDQDFPRLENIHIIMDVQKFRHFAEVLIQGAHMRIEARETTDDMYASIDAAFDKAERRLRRLREKIQDAHRNRPPLPEVEQRIQGVQETQDSDE